jgi:drug/metabolite transporter (DMT)-like permease
MADDGWTWSVRLVFLLLVVVWGLNYPFVNLGLHSASPLWLASLRAGLGAATTVGIVTARRAWGTLDRAGRQDALLLGIPTTALFFGLWFWAARLVTPGIAAVVIYTFPLWVALLSYPILAQRLRPLQWGAVALGFVGVALISQVGTAGSTTVPLSAGAALLGSALAWALGTVLFVRRFRREQMMEANAFQMVGGTVGLLGATLVLAATPLPSPTPDLVFAAVWLGVLGTSIAYAIWFMLLGRTRASTLSAYLFLVPVVALAVGALYFGERLAWVHVLGVVLVLASTYGIARATAPAHSPGPTQPLGL